MTILDDDPVLALIIGLTLADAQGDAVRVAIGKELETATLDDFRYSLVELERRRGLALHLDGQVADRICGVNGVTSIFTRSQRCQIEKLINEHQFAVIVKAIPSPWPRPKDREPK